MASATIAFSALRGSVSGNIACFLNHKFCAVSRSQAVLFGGIQGVSYSIIYHRFGNSPDRDARSSNKYPIHLIALIALSHYATDKVLQKKWNFTPGKGAHIFFALQYLAFREYI
tara:strand:+ start:759 stop:1100 length:342 start_codon:yes stop_codon:yes gene_type:complete